MLPCEKRTTFFIASIYAFRMLGLFMVLPVFSLALSSFADASPFRIGLALGIYGLTQAFLQIPLGLLSDHIGRKPVILAGLLLFILGSILAAMSHTIEGVISGRAIQGAGAIGSTLIALLSDSTAEENRLKAMSITGMVIGFSFMAAMLLGPVLNSLTGLPGIFWFTAGLAFFGIALLFFIPTPKSHLLHHDSEALPAEFKALLTTGELLRLDFGIFVLHASLMGLFLLIPSFLATHFPSHEQWRVYLPVLVLAFLAMFPFVILAEAKRLMKPLFVAAILLLLLAEITAILAYSHLVILMIALWLFFTAFTFLEACLPSLISKIAPAGRKGSAMGLYSSSQFLGIFCGGTVGGGLLHHFGAQGVLAFSSLLGLLWLLFALCMKSPPYLSSKILRLPALLTPEEAGRIRRKLLTLPGVAEAEIFLDEQVAYLKVDKKYFEDARLQDFTSTSFQIKPIAP